MSRVRDWHSIRVASCSVVFPIGSSGILDQPVWFVYVAPDLVTAALIGIVTTPSEFPAGNMIANWTASDPPQSRQMPYPLDQYVEETAIGKGWPPQVMPQIGMTFNLNGNWIPDGTIDYGSPVFFEPDGFVIAFFDPPNTQYGSYIFNAVVDS